jgi:hypothetical protein
MKIMSILLISACIINNVHAESNIFSQPPELGRQDWFLTLLKTLADSGSLNDADRVGVLLGVKFDKTVTNTSPSHAEAFAKSFERVDYTPSTPTWFQAGPIGYAYPGTLGWKPPSDGKSIYFKYYHLERRGLPTENPFLIEFDSVKDDAESTIIFYGINTLTCITLEDITHRFPNIRHMEKTDFSSERYMYYPVIGEENGVVLSFAAMGNKCLSEAYVSEFSQLGKRHARARYKFNKCLQSAAKEFCEDHDQFIPGQHRQTEQENVLRSQMNDYIRKKCVNFNSFYENEPISNEEPPPPVHFGVTPQSHASPCHWYD